MKSFLYAVVLCLPLFFASIAGAQPFAAPATAPTGPAPFGPSSSSASLPDAPDARVAAQDKQLDPRVARTNDSVGPFSAVGIGVKVGVGGIGFDVATPLASRLNLRAGGSFFTYNITNLSESGFNINGSIQLRSVNTSVDWFPFGGSFRISPGITLYNGDNFGGTATVPAGSSITLNNQSYTSSATNPLTATFTTPSGRFGNRVAPSITTGFGNLVPRRRGAHWSVPFEIGMQYIAAPKIVLGLTGTACSTDGCQNVQSDPTTQSNIQAQQNTINSDIYDLRFFPILSIGLGYKF